MTENNTPENPAPQPPEDQTPPPVPETPAPDEPQPDTPELPEDGETPEETPTPPVEPAPEPEIPEPEIPEETPPEPEEPAPEPEIPEETPPEEAPKPELSPEEIFLQKAREELLAKIEEKLLSDPLIKEYVTLTLAGTQNLLATFRELESWFIQNKIDISEHLAFIKEKSEDFAQKVDNFFKDSETTIEEQKQIFEAVQAIKAEIDPALEAITNATALIEEKALRAEKALEGTNKNVEIINGYLDELAILRGNLTENMTKFNEALQAFEKLVNDTSASFDKLANDVMAKINNQTDQSLEAIIAQGNAVLEALTSTSNDALKAIIENKTEALHQIIEQETQALEAIGTSKNDALEAIEKEKEALDSASLENLKDSITALEKQIQEKEEKKLLEETMRLLEDFVSSELKTARKEIEETSKIGKVDYFYRKSLPPEYVPMGAMLDMKDYPLLWFYSLGINGNNGGRYFKTPLPNLYAKGTTDPAQIGATGVSGLPNITGGVFNIAESFCADGWTNGAFSKGGGGSNNTPNKVDWSCAGSFDFNASRSSPIYGRTSDVEVNRVHFLQGIYAGESSSSRGGGINSQRIQLIVDYLMEINKQNASG
ncbi:hypothetical protein [Helicobacter sp. 11S02596-1]|uniref:hypothetical protein n=1 Tax=Helicobacter sp. 11S02596-1 TaxID=1476194 RepID=UPI000BA5CB91|nr:hypothetical protein [Helicobacter sp. 11S02596-1]PAF41206.1 hypothetical protein BJI48_08990 [Helicobacter sp. 11S02596-1]